MKQKLSRNLILLLSIPFFNACSPAVMSEEKDFNAYLPPSFEVSDAEINYIEGSSAEEQNIAQPDVWDVSDVDVSYIDPNRKLIALTFDDAPSKTLERILAVFASFNEQSPDCKATATIFINGKLIDNNALPHLYTANALGIELGNHTHSHFDLTTLSEEELQQEIDNTDRLLARVDNKPRHLLRAPFGKIDERVKTISPVPLIDWTIDTLDWTGKTPDEIFDSIFLSRFSGAIALMHDGYENTVEALKRLLPALKEAGYQAVSVSALAKAHGCVLKRGKVYIRARKQQK